MECQVLQYNKLINSQIDAKHFTCKLYTLAVVHRTTRREVKEKTLYCIKVHSSM